MPKFKIQKTRFEINSVGRGSTIQLRNGRRVTLPDDPKVTHFETNDPEIINELSYSVSVRQPEIVKTEVVTLEKQRIAQYRADPYAEDVTEYRRDKLIELCKANDVDIMDGTKQAKNDVLKDRLLDQGISLIIAEKNE